MELDRAIKARHSCRRFKTKRVNWRDIIKAIDSARLAPLAGNIPTLKFVVVIDNEKIKKLAEACQQSFVGQAGYIVVVVTDPTQLTRSYDERGKRYCSQQAGAAIENFLLKLTDLGLAACWTGAFSDFKVKKVLEIPDKMTVEALFPVGFEMPPKAKQKSKPNLTQCLFFDKWKNRYMKRLRMPEAI